MTLSEFNKAVEKIFRIKADRDNNHYPYYKFEELESRLKKKSFRETCERLESMNSVEGFEIYDSKNYEVSLSQGSRMYYGGRDEICKNDNVNGLNYSLKLPSDE